MEGIRPEIERFALVMEEKFRKHDGQGWFMDDADMDFLWDRLEEELEELEAAILADVTDIAVAEQRVRRECADVANFALLIAMNYGFRSAEEFGSTPTRVRKIENEIARLRQVIVDMRTEAKTLGFDNHEKRKRIEELEKDYRRWQDGIRDAVIDLSGAPDGDIDGGGSESGDPLDFTLAEIRLGFAHLDNTLREGVEKAEAGLHDLKQALREAIKALRVFHGEPGWDSWDKGSPEMKRWRALLDSPQGEERTP